MENCKVKQIISLDVDDQAMEFLLAEKEYKALQGLLPVGYGLIIEGRSRNVHQRRIAERSIKHPKEKRPNERANTKECIEVEISSNNRLEGFKKYMKIINTLKKSYNARPFLEPVDAVLLGIPNYLEVIKEPMDLSTVEEKLKDNQYENEHQLCRDIRLIWSNAQIFNPEGNRVNQMAKEMAELFEELLNKEEDEMIGIKNQVDRYKKKLKDIDDRNYNKKKKYSTTTPQERPLSYNEKKTLSNMIRSLPTEHLWGVWNIVSKGENTPGTEIEFDIDTLDAKTSRELQKYVQNKTAQIQKRKKPTLKKITNTEAKPITTINCKDSAMKLSDPKSTITTESFDKPSPEIYKENIDIVSKSVQPNFVVQDNCLKKESSESSFMSDLESDQD